MTIDKRDLGGNGVDPDPQPDKRTGPPAMDQDDPGSQASADASENDVEQLKAALAAKTAEAAQNYDRFLRERADLDNYKKRAQRERADMQRFGAEQLVRDLLPVVDNLERAIEHAEAVGEGGQLVEGVRLVLKGALDVLARHHVTRIEATGKPFDPAVHEAIAQVNDPSVPANHVVQQLQPGYLLYDRLLRPAQVAVAAPQSEK